MSLEAMSHVRKMSIKPSGKKFVAMALADYADEEWSCFPSVEQLAQYTAQGEKTVRDHLAALEEEGFLTRTRHRRADGTLGRYRFSIQRQFSPAANFARGEKPPQPAANFAAHNHHLEKPSLLLSETSSDEVRKPKKATSYPEQFESFWRDYPRTANMSKKEAFDAWRKLSEEDRTACHQAIPGYIAFLKTKPDLETIHACRFISKRRFDGFANHSPPSIADDDRWLKRLKYARQHKTWSQREWGPPPGVPGCLVPRYLLEPCDGVGWSEWQQQAA